MSLKYQCPECGVQEMHLPWAAHVTYNGEGTVINWWPADFDHKADAVCNYCDFEGQVSDFKWRPDPDNES